MSHLPPGRVVVWRLTVHIEGCLWSIGVINSLEVHRLDTVLSTFELLAASGAGCDSGRRGLAADAANDGDDEVATLPQKVSLASHGRLILQIEFDCVCMYTSSVRVVHVSRALSLGRGGNTYF